MSNYSIHAETTSSVRSLKSSSIGHD